MCVDQFQTDQAFKKAHRRIGSAEKQIDAQVNQVAEKKRNEQPGVAAFEIGMEIVRILEVVFHQAVSG